MLVWNSAHETLVMASNTVLSLKKLESWIFLDQNFFNPLQSFHNPIRICLSAIEKSLLLLLICCMSPQEDSTSSELINQNGCNSWEL
jgi:hypothetical protein